MFKKFAKSFNKGQKGFTLIELLIVIVILGVLAAAIIPNLSKFMGSGVLGAANAELASVRTSIAAYQADHNGDLPAVNVTTGGTVTNTLIQPYITGTTIKGTYSIVGSTGVITGTNDSYATGIVWDSSNAKWVK